MIPTEKNIQFSIAVPENTFEAIEENRGENSRSDYVRSIIEQSEEVKLKKENGSVYTPQNLADFVSGKLISYMGINDTPPSSLTVLDPACGDGELLASFIRLSPKKIKMNVAGLDIDKRAISTIKKRFTKIEQSSFLNTNGLCPFNKSHDQGWDQVRTRIKNIDVVDAVIANPPWGANIDSYKGLVKQSGFAVNRGQVDSSDLFIESALRIVKDNGYIAFIIPDSIFAQDRVNLREFILKNATIKFIGRFGEKLFKDVNRACAVIICQKSSPDKNNHIDCFRLPPEERKLILKGESNFHDIEKSLSHPVLQSRFLKNNGYTFNIDLNKSLEITFNKITSAAGILKKHLSSTRGVELSKKGMVYQCNHCKAWSPLSKNDNSSCLKCQTKNAMSSSKVEKIIHPDKGSGRKLLLVGENIHRYSSKPSLWINVDKNGINYKSEETYKDEKIVIRKTGIGISACLDYTGSYTNQVVYIFKTLNFKIPLEFYLAIINSRLMFFYITMMNGENEWRSHPYITQGQILNIPIPDVDNLDVDYIKRIKKISTELKKCIAAGKVIPPSLDAKLEKMVADFYSMKKSDYKSIYSVIDGSEDLIPVQALKNISIADIFKGRA